MSVPDRARAADVLRGEISAATSVQTRMVNEALGSHWLLVEIPVMSGNPARRTDWLYGEFVALVEG